MDDRHFGYISSPPKKAMLTHGALLAVGGTLAHT